MNAAAASSVAISPISTAPPSASPVRPPTRDTRKTAQSSTEARARLRTSPPHEPSVVADSIQRAATYTGVAHGESPARKSAPDPSPGVAAAGEDLPDGHEEDGGEQRREDDQEHPVGEHEAGP